MLHLVAPAPQAQALLAQPNPVPLVTGRKHQSSPLPLVEPASASSPLLSLSVEPPKGSLSVEPCRTSPFWSSTSPLDGGPLPYGRAINRWWPVEPLPDLMVEHLKVMAASRACLRILMVEPAYASSPYGRAPPDLISRACLRTLKVQFTYWPLKLSNQWSSLLTHP